MVTLGTKVAMPASVRLLSLPIAAYLASGCFYLETVNLRPQAQVSLTTIGQVHRGDRVEFSAAASVDEDGHELSYNWAVRVCDEDGALCAAVTETEILQGGTELAVTVPKVADDGGTMFAVSQLSASVTVVDELGAEASDETTLPVANAEPVVQVQAQGVQNSDGGYPILSRIDFAALVEDGDDALDELTLAWSIAQRPPESVGVDVTAADEDGLIVSLMPDAAGVWTVKLVVTDSSGAVAEDDATVIVEPDMPPCLRGLVPQAPSEVVYLVDRLDGPRRFSVSQVEDDLDPFPSNPSNEVLGQASFAWSLAIDGGAFAPTGGDVNEHLVDAAVFDPGQELRLRVEVADRAYTPECPNDEDTCSAQGNCLQRATWKVRVQ
jgi:hypothetical protein